MNQGQAMALRDITRLLCGKPHLRWRSVPFKGKRPLRSSEAVVEHKRIRVIV